jgi:hypothetical protein
MMDASVAETIDKFTQMLHRHLGKRLVSVALYGSVLFDDLAPGYGDLDFLAVVDADLSEEDQRRLVELRRPLRRPEAPNLDQMLEGALLPRPMLDPAVAGKALWWGTSGERPWERNQLGSLVLHVIRERGRIIWGEDIRGEIPPARREDLLADVRDFVLSAREHGRGGRLHSIEWLLTAARLLLWVREGRLSSKSEAADWGFANAQGDWRNFLPRAKQLRLCPTLIDSGDWPAWLATLDEPIAAATRELAEQLAAAT